MDCPKCGQATRDVDTFCKRCHATLWHKCPACGNRQRQGGKCEKCGIDFLKYAFMLVAEKRVAADQDHDRIERRSNLLKNVLFAPVTGGISLFRYFFVSRER